MTIQAMLRGGTRPITLIRSISVMSTSWKWVLTPKNCGCDEREREPAADAAWFKQAANLGQGYVNFGEPMPLMTYLNSTYQTGVNLSIPSKRCVRPVNADGQ